MAIAGKKVVVQVSTNDTTYNQVAEINDMTMTFSADNIDTTVFGQDFINRIQGLKDGSYNFSGFYAPADTNGQVVIRNAWLNDTVLYAKIFPDGVNGFKQEVKVSNFEVSASVDGVVELSCDFEGTGIISAV